MQQDRRPSAMCKEFVSGSQAFMLFVVYLFCEHAAMPGDHQRCTEKSWFGFWCPPGGIEIYVLNGLQEIGLGRQFCLWASYVSRIKISLYQLRRRYFDVQCSVHVRTILPIPPPIDRGMHACFCPSSFIWLGHDNKTDTHIYKHTTRRITCMIAHTRAHTIAHACKRQRFVHTQT